MNWDILTPDISEALCALPTSQQAKIREIRLRLNQPVSVLKQDGETLLLLHGLPIPVSEKLLKEIFDRATGFSPYALKAEESGLFLPLPGGNRLGLCGDAVISDGEFSRIRRITSMVIRVAHSVINCAKSTFDELLKDGNVPSVLILSPPGTGKTTFLRDLIRLTSEKGFRVSVADERRELGAYSSGAFALDLGPKTDVLSGCPKAQALNMLIRVMNPQVIAVDEISGADEISAVRYAAYSGISVFASAHGTDLPSLHRRPLFRELMDSGTFSYLIRLPQMGQAILERLE